MSKSPSTFELYGRLTVFCISLLSWWFLLNKTWNIYKLIVRVYKYIDVFRKSNKYDERYCAACFSSQSIKRLSCRSARFDPGFSKTPGAQTVKLCQYYLQIIIFLFTLYDFRNIKRLLLLDYFNIDYDIFLIAVKNLSLLVWETVKLIRNSILQSNRWNRWNRWVRYLYNKKLFLFLNFLSGYFF